MTTLTINLDKKLKSEVQKKVKKEGFTITSLISQFFKSYLENEWELRLSPKEKVLRAHKESLEMIKDGRTDFYDNAEDITKAALES